MDMTVNCLPSRTWNHLGLNESHLTIEENNFINHIPNADGEQASCIWEPETCHPFLQENMDTGMGKDVTDLTKDITSGLIMTKSGNHMTTPIILNYTYTENEHGSSRLFLDAEENSTLRAILVLRSETPVSQGSSVLQTKIHAGAGAKIDLYVIQLLGSGFTCLNDIGGICEDHALVNLTKLELGAGNVYVGTSIDLKGTESRFDTHIGYHVCRGQKLDMNYVALHHGKNTESFMDVTGTLENGSKKLFRGTIDFQRGCAGSKGTETENVLLLGDELINQSIPLILCKEEDVEGNHGASIGRLDDKVLFYLSTRGISEEAAQQIIAQSRIDAICNRIPDENLRTEIHNFEQERRVSYDSRQ